MEYYLLCVYHAELSFNKKTPRSEAVQHKTIVQLDDCQVYTHRFKIFLLR